MHINALPFAKKGLTRAAICIAGYSAATEQNQLFRILSRLRRCESQLHSYGVTCPAQQLYSVTFARFYQVNGPNKASPVLLIRNLFCTPGARFFHALFYTFCRQPCLQTLAKTPAMLCNYANTRDLLIVPNC